MMYYSVITQAYSEKEIPSSPNRSRTYDLPITSSDAPPLSYRRLVRAKAIKLGYQNKVCSQVDCGFCDEGNCGRGKCAPSEI